jgi:hypothetical protein
MDRTYKEDIRSTRRALEELKKEFSGVASTTDWTKLRIEPLLDHVKSLERLLRSPKFARDRTVEKGSRDVPLRPGLPPGERQGAEGNPRG